MAGTLLDMKVRIASEIGRADLLGKIGLAINDAIAQYQNTRFRFSDITPSAPPTFNTVAGRYIYTSADNANISTLIKIDYVLIQIGNIQQGLARTSAEAVKLYNQTTTMQGQPSSYAYEGNQLLLAAIPSQVWTITLGLFRQVAAPASDLETDNPWMTDCETLIRSRAKYEIAMHVTQDAAMAAAMSPNVPVPGQPVGTTYAAYQTLKAEQTRSHSQGRNRPMRF